MIRSDPYIRVAFLGLSHPHSIGIYNEISKHPDYQIVAACEPRDDTRERLANDPSIRLTHDNVIELLDGVPCDAVCIGDVYTQRGLLAIEAMKRYKHILADKPLCTRLDELEEIERLARMHGLTVVVTQGVYSLPHAGVMHQLIGEGHIGEVHTINFTGQHPLNLSTRPSWYFEPGAHGGTITDIAVHAFDVVPWVTGRQIVEVTAARTWNAKCKKHPHFHDGAQFMLRLDNDGGVIGDVSYLAPDSCGYTTDQYWRFVIHGVEGVIESSVNSKQVIIWNSLSKQPQRIPVPESNRNSYLDDLSNAVRQGGGPNHPATYRALDATRQCLMTQLAADTKCYPSSLAVGKSFGSS